MNILGAFYGLEYAPLLFLPVLMPILLCMQTLRWQLILRQQDLDVGFIPLFRLNLIGGFYGSISPGNAGTLLRVRYLATLCDRSIIDLSSSVIIDKLIELIILAGFASIGAIVMIKSMSVQVILFIAITTIALVFFFILITRHNSDGMLIERVFSIIFPSSRGHSLRELINRWFHGIPTVSSLMVPFFLSIFIWLLIWTQMFIIAKALSMSISYWLFIALIPISSLTALIPISISGIGTREIALVPLLSVFGISPEKTISMTLLSLVWCAYLPALIGAFQVRYFPRVPKIENNP